MNSIYQNNSTMDNENINVMVSLQKYYQQIKKID